jgi:Fe-S-cluster-containing hydrogenase component 2
MQDRAGKRAIVTGAVSTVRSANSYQLASSCPRTALMRVVEARREGIDGDRCSLCCIFCGVGAVEFDSASVRSLTGEAWD